MYSSFDGLFGGHRCRKSRGAEGEAEGDEGEE
jgi:hypothetical protein